VQYPEGEVPATEYCFYFCKHYKYSTAKRLVEVLFGLT